MKRKVTITMDERLIPQVKRLAHQRGLSLSALIELALAAEASPRSDTFSTRWRGGFRPADRADDERYRQMAKKYL
jgi:hypothetical protein